ncbi:MAG TPA: hypothetical protein VJN95_14905 [Gemmatimonadales bacterium]|nr:hypothetical protein [Gemmatimonadales bacterium]
MRLLSPFSFLLSPRFAVAGLLVLTPIAARAQNPDLMLSQAERDSILKDYHNVFPLLGRKAIERGFDLPKPIGLNIFGLYMNQGIDITDLGLSTGSDPLVPIDVIKFGSNTSTVYSLSFRGDLWVLPFLNFYGYGGQAQANTTVELVEPIGFTSSVDQSGIYGGLGLTGAFGIKRFFAVADINWSWTQLEKLDAPVQGRVLSLRLGKAFKIGRTQRLQVWAGAMNQKFRTETNGSIRLGDAIPPSTVDQIRTKLEDVPNQPWYQNLGPLQKAVVDTIVNHLLNSNAGDITINYGLNKAPSTPWNMLIGSNFDFNKRWTIRGEVGFIGRTSALLNLVYRLDF